eukprot:TRINITY_DN15543_c0_g1_i1.p1 TRINITY_DN15543_c0_g1~~TRINITY_DN15543_c0_g1_i1.p1  ORF type:complete len:304 (-),score=32.59 TRINITY_DN15543_c0_g1_i1:22-933(-)
MALAMPGMGMGGPPGSNSQNLPPQLMALFQPRPPLRYLEPMNKPKCPPYTGIASFVPLFEDPTLVDYSQFKRIETHKERKARKEAERIAKQQATIAEKLPSWNPKNDAHIQSEPRKTLFVARLSYTTTEDSLRREFDRFGSIKSIRLVADTTGKPRGYAFIEYEHERDMKEAYRVMEGKKIDNRRILVDMERARVDESWRPRRLGGGLGNTRTSTTRSTGRVESRREEPRREEPRRPERRDYDRREPRRDDYRRDEPRRDEPRRDHDRRDDRRYDERRHRDDRYTDYDRPARERSRDRDYDRR